MKAIAKRPVPTWKLRCYGFPKLDVQSWTKGEARALMKRKLGLDRLPPGLGFHIFSRTA